MTEIANPEKHAKRAPTTDEARRSSDTPHLKHSDLVKRAEKWLRNTLHCRIVLCELRAATKCYEEPDAIGWVRGKSVLVECKTSKADFRADKKKPMRNQLYKTVLGMGHWRFYFTPPGLIEESELPDGWGLYEVHRRVVKHAGGVKYKNTMHPMFKSDRDSEVAMLVSALSRQNSNNK